MKNRAPLDQLLGKKVLLLGLGREGWSTYHFLQKHLPELPLAVADKNVVEKFPSELQESIRQATQTTFLLGEDYLKNIADYDVIIKTPGIPQTLPEIQAAVRSGVRLTSHTQLFFELCPGKIIGVTGTKGKSTTAAVIHHVLEAHGLDAILVGNIGKPALSHLEEIREDTLVVFELSSHQLETLTVSPFVAVVQDITSEHLDYYKTTEVYQAAKSAITRFQKPDDLVIYDPERAGSARIAALSSGKQLRYSLNEGPDSVAFLRNGTIMLRQPDQRVWEILKTTALPLLGKHNLANVLPSVIVGSVLGISPEEIGEALRSFKPLPHRLEFVREKNGVKFYDDSLATMPTAAARAVDNFDVPIALIAGGYDRQQDFSELITAILAKDVRGIVLFKPSGERLAQSLQNSANPEAPLPEIHFAETMSEAVTRATSLVQLTGGVVLLSPGSASFGMFTDYHDRGEQFKQTVREEAVDS